MCISRSARERGVDENFVKAMERERQTCVYLRNIFAKFSEVKNERGNHYWPRNKRGYRESGQGQDIHNTVNDTEKATWIAFKSVSTNFLGNHKADNRRVFVRKMLSFSKLWSSM